MAAHTNKQSKAAKNAKTVAQVKKAPAAKKPVTKAAPQKAVAKVADKKTPKIVPAKKAVAPKAAPKKSTTINNQKTVDKKNSKLATTTKKAPASSKSVPEKAKPSAVAKKATKPTAKPEVKKAVKPEPKPVAKVAKAAPKPAPKPAAKPVDKTPAKAQTKVVQKAAPAKGKTTASAGASHVVKRKVAETPLPVRPAVATPRPTATPAARPTEKKPNIIIAHRRMENKSKEPKENANTMIQYQPEAYRSILDEAQQQQGPVYRYSDEDLNEFKELITSRLEAARKELLYLQGLITRKDEAGTEDTENRYMNMEDGSGAMEREQLAQLASRQIQFISHLEKALVRIENKTYGICRVTGKLIDKARLRAVPHATLSIEAKKTMANSKG